MPTFGVDEPSQEDQSQHSSRDVETSDPFPPDDSEKYKSFYCQVIVVQVTRYLKTWIPPEAFSYTSTTSKSEMVPPSACMQHLLPTRASFQAVSSKMNKVVSNTFFWFLVCWMSTKTLALCPLPRRYQQPLAKQAQQWPLKVHHTEPKDPKRLATHPSSYCHWHWSDHSTTVGSCQHHHANHTASIGNAYSTSRNQAESSAAAVAGPTRLYPSMGSLGRSVDSRYGLGRFLLFWLGNRRFLPYNQVVPTQGHHGNGIVATAAHTKA